MKNSINMSDFQHMNEHERADYIFDFGEYIETRYEGPLEISLWITSKLYVEVFVTKKKFQVEKIIASDKSEVLNKYLNKVVGNLLSN